MGTYLITGASGGIGEAICRKLAPHHRLVLVARAQKRLDALANTLKGPHFSWSGDMGSDESVSALAKRLDDEQLVL